MRNVIALGLALTLVIAYQAYSHFQVLTPSNDMVATEGSRQLDFDIIFTHPMEQGPVMEMKPPRQFGVMLDGKKHDLRDTLKPVKIDGKTTYTSSYKVKQPGDHIFYLEPAPYWEPAEQKMIVHYTKVIVDSMGAGDAWDQLVGFPVEIEPLTRPNGLWTGNLFRGIVKKHGKPVPFAEIEVEYNNVGSKVKIPGDAYITQVIKADAHGVFAYAMPRAGWWSFAALVDGDEKLTNPDGKQVDVEWGGLIWVTTRDMK